MSPVEIRDTFAALGLHDVSVRQSPHGDHYWIVVSRMHHGHKDTYTERLTLAADAAEITMMADRISEWWKHLTGEL
jgi:hypothetical protein